MSKIDLGFLNRRQLNRLIKAVARSEVNMIELHVLKRVTNMGVVLVFRNNKDKDRFDAKSYKLVQALKRL